MEMVFQQQLEGADFEVSIELYPTMDSGKKVHYQIFKPSCSIKHCWEVYRNPRNKELEVDIDRDCATLDDAWTAMTCDFACQEIKEAKRAKLLEAIDTVCGECIGTERQCEECMVRKMADDSIFG